MKTYEKIEMNPQIMFGKPVIKNTRITVEQILRKLSGGMTIEEIIKDHPRLTPEDIYTAQAFAADYLADLDNLPDPDVLANDIIENLEAAVESFKEIAQRM